MNEKLKAVELLTRSGMVWQGYQTQVERSCCPTQYAMLNEELAGGIPTNGVIEVRTLAGIGELRLIFPYLAQRQTSGMIVFIAPPTFLNAESLRFSGLNLTNTLVIDANDKDALWCAEQCLKSGSCASVILWQATIETHQVRRLTLACEQGNASLFIYRPQQTDNLFSLPAKLALKLAPHEQGLEIEITKKRGGRPSQPFVLNMQALWPDLALSPLPSNVVPFTEFKSRAS